jgi:hypothetical protein
MKVLFPPSLMYMKEYVNPQQETEDVHELDAKIAELDMKAQSSSGAKKLQYLSKIRELIIKKDGLGLQDKTKGFSERFGL